MLEQVREQLTMRHRDWIMHFAWPYRILPTSLLKILSISLFSRSALLVGGILNGCLIDSCRTDLWSTLIRINFRHSIRNLKWRVRMGFFLVLENCTCLFINLLWKVRSNSNILNVAHLETTLNS